MDFDTPMTMEWIQQFIDAAFTYHPPNATQIPRYEALRAKAKEFAELVGGLVPISVEQAQAFIHIQSAVMWANAGIAINETEEANAKKFNL